MTLFDPNSPSARAYNLQHRSPAVRAQTIRTLETLIERYPNLRLGQLISNAIAGRDLFNIEDDELGLALNQLFVTYTQFEAAGIDRRKV
jgi:hypothetical protein